MSIFVISLNSAAYHEMKLQLSKCRTFHSLSDTAPITLHTDASDYGVGEYFIPNS